MRRENHKAAETALFAFFAKELRARGFRLGYEGLLPDRVRWDPFLPAAYVREGALARCARYINGGERREGMFTLRLYTNEGDTVSRRSGSLALWELADLVWSRDLSTFGAGLAQFAWLSPDSAPTRVHREGSHVVWEMRFVYRLR